MMTGLPMVTIAAEVQHVGLKPPWQRVTAADHAVLGNGGDKEDLYRGQIAGCQAA